jgi:hypothetical protein
MGRYLQANQTFSISVNNQAAAYYIVTPIEHGLAFLGDADKFVSNGKQRIDTLNVDADKVTADVLFAPTEKSIILHGYSIGTPAISVKSGSAGPVRFNQATGQFAFEIKADLQTPPDNSQADPVRHVLVILRAKSYNQTAQLNNVVTQK